MTQPVIIDAVRIPYGKRNGALSNIHAVELLGFVQHELLSRLSLDSAAVDESIVGCVTQAGEQSGNIARFAWLHQGHAISTGNSTVDVQCASGQQATHLAAAQIAAGVADITMASGVESMSRVPLLSNLADGQFGKPRPDTWTVDLPAQYEAADRIALNRGFTREMLDEFGAKSQQKAAAAWAANRFEKQIIPFIHADGTSVSVDEGLRDTTAASLANLKPIREGGLHTAGTASQISDGATAAILMSADRANADGYAARGRIAAQCLTGGETHYLLDGPVQAIEMILSRTRMSISDIDIFEINEAFAAVPMSAALVHNIPEEKLNVNGGAIAIGHAVGSTGVRLIATVLDELERIDGQFGLIVTCAGGGLAIATLIERL